MHAISESPIYSVDSGHLVAWCLVVQFHLLLCCSAQNFDLLCSILCSCKRKSDCSIRVYSLVSEKIFNMVTVLLEYINYQLQRVFY